MELLYILVGICVGVIISFVIFRIHFIGNLRIDNSDPEDGPYMFLELKKGFGDISSKKHVILKVKRKNFLPHE